MAVTLRIEDRQASTTVDLYGDTDSIKIMAYDELPDVDYTTFALRLKIEGASKAATRSATLALVDLLEQAVDWANDPLQHESVWLRELSDGETDKRALIVGYQLVPVSRPAVNKLMTTTSTQVWFDLALTTLNVWENAYYDAGTATTIITSGTSALNVSINGGKFTVASGGNVDGRLWYFQVYGNATHKMAKIWAGMRPARLGTASFTPRLDAAAGTASTDTATDTGNSGYSDTGSMLTTFVDETMQTRWSIGIGDEDMFGRYLVLVRHKYDGIAVGGTGYDFAVRVNVSLSTTAYSEPISPTPTQYIGSDNWTLTEIGEIQLPPAGLRDAIYDQGDDYFTNMQLNFEAARVDGTLDLVVDCIILIPAEHMITIEGDQDADIARWTEVHTYEDGEVAAYEMAIVATNNTIIGLAAVTAKNWASPHDGGVCVIAAAPPSGTTHDATEDVDVIRTTVNRYRTYHD